MTKPKLIVIRKYDPKFLNGTWHKFYKYHRVRLMTSADNYLMVRHKGCIPFVVYKTDVCDDTQPVNFEY